MSESQIDTSDFDRRVEKFKLNFRLNEASKGRISEKRLTKKAHAFAWDDIALDGLSDEQKSFARNFREMLFHEFGSEVLASPTFSVPAPEQLQSLDKAQREIFQQFITKESYNGIEPVPLWELLVMGPTGRARLVHMMYTHPRTKQYVLGDVRLIPIFSRGLDENMDFHFTTDPFQ